MSSKYRAFSLVEILVVVGILVVLLAFSLPAFMGQSKAANLRLAGDQLKAGLLLARQQALALNSAFEVRFYAESGTSGFTAYQILRVEGDGSSSPASKVEQFPANVVIPDEAELSPLLTESSLTGTQSGGGPSVEGWNYAAIQFRSSGELVDVDKDKAFLTLVDSQQEREAGKPPVNFVLVTVQPMTGMVMLTQP
jgi:uncharacterized protein (TIGR02596 family)